MCVFPPEEDLAEFPGGPKDTSVLTSYKSHFARYHRLTLVPVSHGKKMKELVKITSDAQWFRDTVEATGCRMIDHTPISKYQGIDALVSLLRADPIDAHSEYFEDLELVSDYAWGVSALAFLYNGLSAANMPKWTTVTSYMTLLQAWIHAHFPRICGGVQVSRYDESESAAMKYIPTKGDIISTYRLALDRTLGCDITWALYSEH
ncbi:uncharacterized protein LOC123891792 [Trifolium pratense]|uniref:uncharacterized protein LOC123891792 n=1 Tax=Trifolium pratense TaxID=57577 RepID=UPI001E6945A7|nr:uncharacterized protein LOC123891792 [Trifolium pratense]